MTVETVMTKPQAWKAFRMGVIAACAPDRPDEAFWKVMRRRFDDWWISYADGLRRKREAALVQAHAAVPFNATRKRVAS